MKTTDSNIAPPGAPRGGPNIPGLALGAPGGVFAPMKRRENPEDLRKMLAKTKGQLTAALTDNARLYEENKRLKEAAEKP